MMTDPGTEPDRAVEIHISLVAFEPPSGSVHLEGERNQIDFTGWLDLLKMLEEFVHSHTFQQSGERTHTKGEQR